MHQLFSPLMLLPEKDIHSPGQRGKHALLCDGVAELYCSARLPVPFVFGQRAPESRPTHHQLVMHRLDGAPSTAVQIGNQEPLRKQPLHDFLNTRVLVR